MSESKYATFNDPPEEGPTELEKAEAIMAKPWRELTWKERLFKGTVYAAAGAAAFAAGAAASNRSGGGQVYYSRPDTPIQPPAYQPPQYHYSDRFHPGMTLAEQMYPGVVDPSGLYSYQHGIGAYGNGPGWY